MNWLKPFLEKFFETKANQSNKKNGTDKATPFHMLILVLVIGISIMLVSNMVSSKNKTASSAASSNAFSSKQQQDIATFKSKTDQMPDSMKSYEKDYEDRLTQLLNQVEGISNVKVMVVLATSEQEIFDKDTNSKSSTIKETDSNNGHRTTTDNSQDQKTVIVGSGDNQEPVTIGKKKPQVEGVMIVAQGADNIQLKSMIVQAVSSVLGVPEYKVNVLLGKPKGE